VEDLITTISDTIEIAKTKINELTIAQSEIATYSKNQQEFLDDAVEKLISLIRVKQEKVKKDFDIAAGIESQVLNEEEKKMGQVQEELKAKSVELGNMIDSLGLFII
jgi:L-2-hydroxyglutarate oxidase LhgO